MYIVHVFTLYNVHVHEVHLRNLIRKVEASQSGEGSMAVPGQSRWMKTVRPGCRKEDGMSIQYTD
jgi:hypothetical protein